VQWKLPCTQITNTTENFRFGTLNFLKAKHETKLIVCHFSGGNQALGLDLLGDIPSFGAFFFL